MKNDFKRKRLFRLFPISNTIKANKENFRIDCHNEKKNITFENKKFPLTIRSVSNNKNKTNLFFLKRKFDLMLFLKSFKQK